MARHKWTSPSDWLADKINRWAEAARADMKPQSDSDCALTELVCICNDVVNGGLDVDEDSIQDAYQDQMDADGYFRDLSLIDNLTREQCVEILGEIEIQSYDHETVETLRQAIEDNVEDGTIEWSSITERSAHETRT